MLFIRQRHACANMNSIYIFISEYIYRKKTANEVHATYMFLVLTCVCMYVFIPDIRQMRVCMYSFMYVHCVQQMLVLVLALVRTSPAQRNLKY